MFPGVFYALLAGFLGAVASSSAKLSLGADYLKGVCETGLRTWGEQRKFRQADETTTCDRLHIPLRLLCGGLLFTCNAVMWTFLAKALRYSSSSTRTTVTTTASNFISSFVAVLVLKPEELLELSQSDHGAAAAGLVETRLMDVCVQFLMEA
ncbi:hypothetical protein INR49_027465, partial [Caranx melampygus]